MHFVSFLKRSARKNYFHVLKIEVTEICSRFREEQLQIYGFMDKKANLCIHADNWGDSLVV